MKLHIEIDDGIEEDEIIIHCKEMTDDILKLQKQINQAMKSSMQLQVMKQEMEYFIQVDEILFLESSDSMVAVHTKGQIYFTRQKLYELDDLLPGNFMRVSKSTIVNTDKIRGIQKNITGASAIEFGSGNQKAYASRNYIKALMEKLEEKRLRR